MGGLIFVGHGVTHVESGVGQLSQVKQFYLHTVCLLGIKCLSGLNLFK